MPDQEKPLYLRLNSMYKLVTNLYNAFVVEILAPRRLIIFNNDREKSMSVPVVLFLPFVVNL